MKISQKRKSERQELLREEQKREQRRSYHQVNERLSHDVNVFSFGGPDERGCRKTSKSTDNGIKHTVKYVDGSVFSKREDRKGIFQV